MSDLARTLSDFLSQAQGRSFCDGCLALELHVNRVDVQPAFDNAGDLMDRGRGRCSVCGQTLTVTRVATE